MNPAKILVVDDTPSNVKALRMRLSSEGYEILEAFDGPQALEKTAHESPDLILLDVMMPGMDGYEVCRRIKSQPETQFIPVVLITSLSDQQSRITGIEAGADDFLNKPADPHELHARVKSLLRSKSLYDELQRQYEELRKLVALRETLTHMIVHDLRNPLASVLGYVDLLEISHYVSSEEKPQEYLRTITRGLRTLMDMITAMLDLARLEAGEMRLNLEDVDLGQVVSDVETGMRSLLEKKRLELRIDLPHDLPPLRADRESLRRILVNILSNAIAFSPMGGAITLTARLKEGDVCVAVQDEGPGIPPEYQEKIFDKFGQVEGRQSGRKYSTGLGLAFCKMAVEAHGGKIGVRSEAGEGATFTIRIPSGAAG